MSCGLDCVSATAIPFEVVSLDCYGVCVGVARDVSMCPCFPLWRLRDDVELAGVFHVLEQVPVRGVSRRTSLRFVVERNVNAIFETRHVRFPRAEAVALRVQFLDRF